jgi:hypothetical protein
MLPEPFAQTEADHRIKRLLREAESDRRPEPCQPTDLGVTRFDRLELAPCNSGVPPSSSGR